MKPTCLRNLHGSMIAIWFITCLLPAVDAQEPAQPNAPPVELRQPSWEDFQALAGRLEATEAKLREVTGPANAVGVLPEKKVEEQGTSADKKPAATSEERLSAVEKAVAAKPAAATFPNVRLSGFFHLDSGLFAQDANNRATLGDIQDGIGFRRARLQALGSVGEFTNYSLEMDFATAGRPSFMDVWGEQTQLPFFGNVRIGQFRQAFSMDALTSIKQLDFLERSLPFQAFLPFRRVGIMAYDKSDSELTTWAYGAYRTGGFLDAPLGDSRVGTDIGDSGGYSFSGRTTHLLYFDEPADGRYLLHVGGSYDYSRITGRGDPLLGDIYNARVIPEFFVGDPAGGGVTSAGTPFFVDTGRLSADAFNLFGLELAGQYGPSHFQAEYMATTVNQLGGSDVFYDGAYVQGGYFLTGENRTYNRTTGTFDKITPFTEFFGLGRKNHFCGWGAWEVTARWSYVNLNSSQAIPFAPVAVIPPVPNAGRMSDTTLGLNWIWNAYAKVQFNWIHCNLDNAVRGNSDCNIYASRFEVTF